MTLPIGRIPITILNLALHVQLISTSILDLVQLEKIVQHVAFVCKHWLCTRAQINVGLAIKYAVFMPQRHLRPLYNPWKTEFIFLYIH